jgi:predicted transcriptional regulator
MVKEKYLQEIMDVIHSKGCVTRRFIVDYLIQQLKLSQQQSENIVDEVLASLVKRNVITRKGRGVYCWADPP